MNRESIKSVSLYQPQADKPYKLSIELHNGNAYNGHISNGCTNQQLIAMIGLKVAQLIDGTRE